MWIHGASTTSTMTEHASGQSDVYALGDSQRLADSLRDGASSTFNGLLAALWQEHQRLETQLNALQAENSRLRASEPTGDAPAALTDFPGAGWTQPKRMQRDDPPRISVRCHEADVAEEPSANAVKAKDLAASGAEGPGDQGRRPRRSLIVDGRGPRPRRPSVTSLGPRPRRSLIAPSLEDRGSQRRPSVVAASDHSPKTPPSVLAASVAWDAGDARDHSEDESTGSEEGARIVAGKMQCLSPPAHDFPDDGDSGFSKYSDASAIMFKHCKGLNTRAMVSRVQKLHRWWVRIDQSGTGVLTRQHLQAVCARMNSTAKPVPDAAMDRLLYRLSDPDVVEYILDEDALDECSLLADAERLSQGAAMWNQGSAQSLDGGGLPQSIGEVMTFQSFVVLIVWEGLQDLLPLDLHVTATKLRDALTRHSAEMLVAHYAHLKVGDSEDAKPPPNGVFVLDSISGVIIAMNAITIGISSDYSSLVLDRMEVFFSFYFAFELLCKLYYSGVKQYLVGPEMRWNWFDILVVFLSLVDTTAYFYELTNPNADVDGPRLGSVSIIRLARLARLTRLVRLLRVLRLRMFRELTLIAKGVVAGMRMLVWAIVMLFFVVYFGAVCMRQTVGPDRVQINDAYGTVLFSDLVWSMFMIFRILMQDGSLPDGTPIAGRMYELYGVGFMLPYMLSLLFVVFGVFNLMTALFVENVLEAAKQKKQLSIAQERIRVARKLRDLVLKFTGQKVSDDPGLMHKGIGYWLSFNPFSVYDSSAEAAESVLGGFRPAHMEFEMDGSITRHMFQEAIRDPMVETLLDELEVHMSDRSELFEVLDADGSGAIDIAELIAGLMKLRSAGTDKSIGVATVLGIRAIMKRVADIETSLSSGAWGSQRAEDPATAPALTVAPESPTLRWS